MAAPILASLGACSDRSFDLRLEHRLNSRAFDAIRADSSLLADAIDYGAGIFRRQTCSSCHGPTGEGDPTWCPALNDDEWIWGGSDEEAFRTIKYGVRQLTAPSTPAQPRGVPMRGTRYSIMPRFDGILTSAQIAEVSFYVRNLAAGRTQWRGRDVYLKYCAGCHLESGSGNQRRTRDRSIRPGNGRAPDWTRGLIHR